jgi:hypothetical protein
MRVRSGLARSIHLSHATVRFAAIVTVVVGAAAGAITLALGDGPADAVQMGILAGGAAFIAWALTREIAPDHPITAGAAAVLSPALLIAGPVDLLVAGLLILPVRIVAGTTGRDLTLIDIGALAVGAAALSFRESGVAVALLLGLAPAASAWWARGSRRLLIGSSCVIATGVVALTLFLADHDPWVAPVGFERGILLGGLAAGLVAAWVVPPVTSPVDSRKGGRVLTLRIRLARLAALVAGVSTALWAGGTGVMALGPAWVALAVTAVSSIATLGD